jgi:hypothetical protein
MCTHPIDVTNIHLLRCADGNKHMRIPNVIHNTLLPLHEMLASMRDENNYMHFLKPRSIPFVEKMELCSPKMKFAS